MAYLVEIGPSALREAEKAYLYIAQDAPEAAVEWFKGAADAAGDIDP